MNPGGLRTHTAARTLSSTRPSPRQRHRLALLALLLAGSALLLAGCASTRPPPGVTAVTPFDLQRYQGRWYELARLDHAFERGMTECSPPIPRRPTAACACGPTAAMPRPAASGASRGQSPVHRRAHHGVAQGVVLRAVLRRLPRRRAGPGLPLGWSWGLIRVTRLDSGARQAHRPAQQNAIVAQARALGVEHRRAHLGHARAPRPRHPTPMHRPTAGKRTMAYTVVWFKCDLRVHDHAPRSTPRARPGAVPGTRCWSSACGRSPTARCSTTVFCAKACATWPAELRTCGATLQLAVGRGAQVLAHLHALQPFARLASHEETGNAHTYARDLAVARSVPPAMRGLARVAAARRGAALPSRDRWHALAGLQPGPAGAPAAGQPGPGPALARCLARPRPLGLLDLHDPPLRQRGGRTLGQAVLHEFLQQRSAGYRAASLPSPRPQPARACRPTWPWAAWACARWCRPRSSGKSSSRPTMTRSPRASARAWRPS